MLRNGKLNVGTCKRMGTCQAQSNALTAPFSELRPPFTYQVLQLFWTTSPGWCMTSPSRQGHMLTGTHCPASSCASPRGHWHPGTQPGASRWQLRSSRRSAQEPPQGRPHSWCTCPPEHVAAGTGRARESLFILSLASLLAANDANS